MELREDKVVAGRYRLLARVGGGGMGVVWRARDEVLDREVAIKEVLAPAGLSESEREITGRRAVREARSAARLSHPGVVTVFDVVEEQGRPWVVMEYVAAPSLQQVISTAGPIPPRRVAGIGRQMLAALGAAHAVGILHRDVKPGNVLLGPGDRAVLTDFGIAVIEGEVTLTQSGGILGSPAYIAPERIRGERATPASDLWALGVTLYAAVEGRPPFHRTDPVAVFGAVLAEEPVVSDRAGPLKPLIEGLLRKDPAARITAGVAEAILIAVAGEGPAPWPARDTTVRFPVPEPPPVRPPAPWAPSRWVAGLAGPAAYAGAPLVAAGTAPALLGVRHPAAAAVPLGLLAGAHALVALGLYGGREGGAQAKITLLAGLLGAAALLGVVIFAPAPSSVPFGVLWCATGLWLGVAGLSVAARSRAVALAGEIAVAPWILLISAPALGPGARTLVLGLNLVTYGCWAVSVGRLLRRAGHGRAGRSSRAAGPSARLRLD